MKFSSTSRCGVVSPVSLTSPRTFLIEMNLPRFFLRRNLDPELSTHVKGYLYFTPFPTHHCYRFRFSTSLVPLVLPTSYREFLPTPYFLLSPRRVPVPPVRFHTPELNLSLPLGDLESSFLQCVKSDIKTL